MIVVYKPEEPQYFNETYDVNTGAMKNRGTPLPKQTRTGRFRLASAETKGETEMPQPAPLIFPQLEKWAAQGGTPYKPEAAGFLRDYFDRRAQATFVSDFPILPEDSPDGCYDLHTLHHRPCTLCRSTDNLTWTTGARKSQCRYRSRAQLHHSLG